MSLVLCWNCVCGIHNLTSTKLIGNNTPKNVITGVIHPIFPSIMTFTYIIHIFVLIA